MFNRIYRKYLNRILFRRLKSKNQDIFLNLKNDSDIKKLAKVCPFRQLTKKLYMGDYITELIPK